MLSTAEVLPPVQASIKGVTDQLELFKKQLPEAIASQLQSALFTVKQDLQRISAENQGGQAIGDGLKVS